MLLRALADPLEHPGGQRGVDQRQARGDPAYTVDQVVPADLLQHITVGAGEDRGEECLVVVVAGEDQGLDARVDRTHLTAHVDPAAVGQPAVEDCHVRLERRDPGDGLPRRAGLTDDLDVTLALQQVVQPTTDDLVVVEQKHPDRLGHHPSFVPVAAAFGTREAWSVRRGGCCTAMG